MISRGKVLKRVLKIFKSSRPEDPPDTADTRINPFISDAIPPVLEADSPTNYLNDSSSRCSTKRSIDSLPYSYASSRTTTTDYGMFYTRHGLSSPSSLLESPTTPQRGLMSPCMLQPTIYQQYPLGIFPTVSFSNSFDLSHSVPVETLVSSRSDFRVSSFSELIEEPPPYDPMEQDNSREDEQSRLMYATESSTGDLQAENQAILEQKILELQRTSVRLQETLIRHEADLREAVDQFRAYREQMNIANVWDQAQNVATNRNILSPVYLLAAQQTETANTHRDSIQRAAYPTEGLANVIGNQDPGTTDDKQRVDQRVDGLDLPNVDLGQSITKLKTVSNIRPQPESLHHQHFKNSLPSGPSGSNQSSHFSVPANGVLEHVDPVGKEMLASDSRYLLAATGNRLPFASPNPANVEDNPQADHVWSENQEGISKEFYQIDEYLARFEERLTLHKSACEERLICCPNGNDARRVGGMAYDNRKQEVLQQMELVDKLDSVIWRVKEGRKNLKEICCELREDSTTSKKQEHVEIRWQDDHMNDLEHALVSLFKKQTLKRRIPRQRDDKVYVTRKSAERKWKSNALR